MSIEMTRVDGLRSWAGLKLLKRCRHQPARHLCLDHTIVLLRIHVFDLLVTSFSGAHYSYGITRWKHMSLDTLVPARITPRSSTHEGSRLRLVLLLHPATLPAG